MWHCRWHRESHPATASSVDVRVEVVDHDFLLRYVMNMTGQGAYQGFDQIHWMQEVGRLADRFGQTTPVNGPLTCPQAWPPHGRGKTCGRRSRPGAMGVRKTA